MNILFLLTTIIESTDLEKKNENENTGIELQEIKRREFCSKKSLAKQNVKRFCDKFWENLFAQNIHLQSSVEDVDELINIEIGHGRLVFELWLDYIIALIDGRKWFLDFKPRNSTEILENFGFETYTILKRINSNLDFSKLDDDVVIEKMAKDLSNCMDYDIISLIMKKTLFIFKKKQLRKFLNEKIPIYKNELGIGTNESASNYDGLSYFPFYNTTTHVLLRIQDIDCESSKRHTREVASELNPFSELESQGELLQSSELESQGELLHSSKLESLSELLHSSKLESLSELLHSSKLESQGGLHPVNGIEGLGGLQQFSELDVQGDLQSYQQVNGVGVLHPMGTGLFIIALITLILGLFNFFKRN